LQPTLGAAAPNEATVCSVRLSGGNLWQLNPLIYLHSRRIKTVMGRMNDVMVNYTIVDSSHVPDKSNLPILRPFNDFTIAVFSNQSDSTMLRGSLRLSDKFDPSKKVQELGLSMGTTSLAAPFSDVETLAILVSLSSAPKADFLTLDFDLDRDQEMQWATLITDLKSSARRDEAGLALNFPAIAYFLDVVPFKLAILSLTKSDGDYPANLRLSFDTRRIELLREHVHYKPI
jgi:hypothetical protein